VTIAECTTSQDTSSAYTFPFVLLSAPPPPSPPQVLPSLHEHRDEVLLRELLTRWNNHKVMVRWLSRFFNYLDRCGGVSDWGEGKQSIRSRSADGTHYRRPRHTRSQQKQAGPLDGACSVGCIRVSVGVGCGGPLWCCTGRSQASHAWLASQLQHVCQYVCSRVSASTPPLLLSACCSVCLHAQYACSRVSASAFPRLLSACGEGCALAAAVWVMYGGGGGMSTGWDDAQSACEQAAVGTATAPTFPVMSLPYITRTGICIPGLMFSWSHVLLEPSCRC